MKSAAAVALLGLMIASPLPRSAQAEDGPPAWAYPMNPAFKPAPDDGKLRHVPDSTAAFTVTQARNLFDALDWHPSDHPPMPDVVAHGSKPNRMACGVCHRADGPGGPESASLAGLPAAYIVQQMADFRGGVRTSSVPQRGPPKLMIKTAKATTEAEAEAAADYFSALTPRANIKVVEAETVPKTRAGPGLLMALPGGEKEPIAGRIIELPDNLERFDMRDSHAHFTAYVPPGSVEKGRQFVATGGGGKTAPCTICHGPDLRGMGPIPRIAGRSPSYIVRQLYDFQHGTRAGLWSPLMTPNVIKLTTEDMVALAAYAASLPP
jgi:cytochrome c553